MRTLHQKREKKQEGFRGTAAACLVADLETLVVGTYFEERDDLTGVDLARRSQVMNVNAEPFSRGIEK